MGRGHSLWSIKVSPTKTATIFRNGKPLSSQNGEEYGSIVSVSSEIHTSSKKVMIKVGFQSTEGRKQCFLQCKYFNIFSSDDPFKSCTSGDCTQLALELQNALLKLEASKNELPVSLLSNTSSCSTTTQSTPPSNEPTASTVETVENPSENTKETPQGPSITKKNPRKRLLPPTPISGKSKKPEESPSAKLQKSCESCLVSDTSQFIPIGNICLPESSSRQFRRVNEKFVDLLEKELEKEPCGSYGALFVVPKGVNCIAEYNLTNKEEYTYEVLGGTHLTLATKRLHTKYPEKKHFHGRMAMIYVGLTDEQAIHLGAMHQNTSSFNHDITYREEVERCRAQLFSGNKVNLDQETPEPYQYWREDCSRILYKEKRILSEVFTMARVSKATWNEFIKVHDMYEKGLLKNQKFSTADVVKGKLSMKQWHMKPLVSTGDETKLFLLKKISAGDLSLQDLKKEADEVKAIQAVQSAIIKFFGMESWAEARQKFGAMVEGSKLVRFTGNIEHSHEFQTYLQVLKNKDENLDVDDFSDVEEFSSSNGKNKGHIIFSPFADVKQSLEFFKAMTFRGVFLTIGEVGFETEEREIPKYASCTEVIEMATKLNFTVLSTFSVIFLCPASAVCKVVETLNRRGASELQYAYILHKGKKHQKRGHRLHEVVTSIVISHWTISGMASEAHVNFKESPTNVIEAEREDEIKVYNWIIENFSREEDMVLQVGGSGNVFLAAVINKRKGLWVNNCNLAERAYVLKNLSEDLEKSISSEHEHNEV